LSLHRFAKGAAERSLRRARFHLEFTWSIAMAEYRETHQVTTDSGEKKSSATPWLAFFLGALLIAVVAIFFMNAQGTYSGPGGRATFNIKSPVTVAPDRPAEPAPVK
jgi:hypothetical protein